MILIDYVFMAIFAAFIIPIKTRASALVLFFGYVAYALFAFEISGLHRYGYIALINAVSGVLLTYWRKDYPMAILFFAAVFVCFAGGVLYIKFYPAYYYDNMCITIMTLQAIALFYKAILNGISIRGYKFYSLYGNTDSDISKRCIEMLESKKKKEANR